MIDPINNLTRQIRLNLSQGDPVEKAIERPNVKKALEILALRLQREKWLMTMSLDELVEGYNQSQMEKGDE